MSQPQSLWLLNDVHAATRGADSNSRAGGDSLEGGALQSGSLFAGTGVMESLSRRVPGGIL